ncbi:MAG: DUF721 domain-containing protein, partial [Nitrospinota bacterium]
MKKPVPLGEVLRGLRRSAPWGARLGRGEVWRLWEEVVGPTVARVARPCDAEGGRLWVEVDGPAWLHELKLMEGTILKKLNSRLEGEPRLERIFFQLGRRSRRPLQVEPESPPPHPGGPLPPEEEVHLGAIS